MSKERGGGRGGDKTEEGREESRRRSATRGGDGHKSVIVNESQADARLVHFEGAHPIHYRHHGHYEGSQMSIDMAHTSTTHK